MVTERMEWYPTPSYLVKRNVILDFLRTIPVGNFLEVGCGAGDLLVSLANHGYRGMGIDISAEALAAARNRLTSSLVTVEHREISDITERFDVIIASEVLEHVHDDVGLLRQFREKIRVGGHVVITVPAHMAKWGVNDDFCGHLRRYERQELHEKLLAAGLQPVCIYSYGVPVYNMMKPLYDRAIRKQYREGREQRERTKESSGMWLFTGMKKLFGVMFNDLTMYPFYLLQRLFFRTDLGNGYFAVARLIVQEGEPR